MRFPLMSKLLMVAAVMGLISLVLLRIDGLVDERRQRQREAQQGVAQSFAGEQTLLGPLLHRSCTEEWAGPAGADGRATTERREFVLTSVPQALVAGSTTVAEARYRGLFKVNGYGAATTLSATWPSLQALQPQRSHEGSRLQCGPGVVMLAVGDVRGVRSARLQADGTTLPVRAGTASARYPRGLHAELPAARLAAAADALQVTLVLELVGTERLALVPAAQDTTWTLAADWPHPSFGGRFLPTTREVHAKGFEARWTVSSLASAAAGEVFHKGELCSAGGAMDAAYDESRAAAARPGPCLDTLEVAFIDPVNPYVLTDRATKYALLFIVLTFVSVLLVEVLARRRVHPVQYTLVGLALAMFYLLLLSLSEHLAFGAAYGLSSAACVLLLGFYAAHMLGTRGAGAGFGAAMAALYGALWVLLQREQTALVIGSLLLFAVLAVVMVLTRRVDWYALFDGWRPAPAAPDAVADAAPGAAH